MNTKTLSNPALLVIDRYLNFKIGSAVCSIPYFNNKTIRARAALSVLVGKGSPKEISDEVQIILQKNHVATDSVTSEALKKLLTDNNIGIDCSGFAFHVLNAQKPLKLVLAEGFFKRLLSSLHPAKNADVVAFTDNENSKIFPLKSVQPGDIITMIGGEGASDRNHILIIHQVDYNNSASDMTSSPTKIDYSHAIAYPEDGVYGTGIRQGTITITDPDKSLLESMWAENNLEGPANRIFVRALKSKTELRRLNWLS